MKQSLSTVKNNVKQRLTAFVDPILVKRAKVRGALEGFTISEIVEKALDAYAPKLEKDTNQHIHLKFTNGPTMQALIRKKGLTEDKIPKRT